jgi:hypothetical protein
MRATQARFLALLQTSATSPFFNLFLFSAAAAQALRAARIEAELDVAAATRELAGMRGHLAHLGERFESLRSCIDGLSADRESGNQAHASASVWAVVAAASR